MLSCNLQTAIFPLLVSMQKRAMWRRRLMTSSVDLSVCRYANCCRLMVMYSGEGDEHLDESLKTTAKVKYVQQSVNSIAMTVYSMNNILREAYTK